MNRLKLLVAVLFFVFSGNAYAQTNLQFIIDFSGSMTKELGGKMQIDSAREALLDAIHELPEDHSASLRVYGHTVEKDRKKESCLDSQMLVDFGLLSTAKIRPLIENLDPKGYTPIAYSLEKAAEDLQIAGVGTESKKAIILLTDGEETCGGDPLGVLKKLRADGIKVIVNTIGFNVDNATRKQLKSLSEYSGGAYYDAKDASSLKDSLSQATKASLFIDKKKELSGDEIRGGDGYETAVTMPLSKDLKLTHHQKAGDYDYLKFVAFKGDQIVIEVKSLEKGLDKSLKENDEPYGTIRLLSSDKTTLQLGGVKGQFLNKKMTFDASYSGTYYLLIGSKDYAQHKDHIKFRATLVKRGDLDTENDAGDTIETAMPINEPGRFKGYLGYGGDAKDYYSLDVSAGDTYFIGIAPSWCKSQFGGYKVKVINDFAENYTKVLSPNSCSGVKSKVTFNESEVIYILVERRGSSNKVNYSLVVKKKSSDRAE